jgi:transposase
LSIDETSLSNGELYTILTNREGYGGKGSLIAVVAGTKSEDVIEVPEKIPEEERAVVKEVPLDLSESMNRTVRRCFPEAFRVIDRFHVQKLACDAVLEIRIKHWWEAIEEETDSKEEAKGKKDKLLLIKYIFVSLQKKWI